MDWDLAIDRNREALLRLLAGLYAMLGIAPGASVPMLPSSLHRLALGLLRPAEAATRRLIVLITRIETITPLAMRPAPADGFPQGKGRLRAATFPLFDPRKPLMPAVVRVGGPGPRMCVPGLSDPTFPERVLPSPDRAVTATRLCARMQALQTALHDLPRQARRLLRQQERRKTAARACPLAPLRPGRPPGHRERHLHEVDDILSECHRLVLWATQPPDTS